MSKRRDLAWPSMLAAVFLAAVFLRLCGIGYGLPAVFNADEPHHVNIAVSFGRGSLNPMVFKYPTLWMYMLFAAYGAYFLAWSGLGMLHTVREFGQLFVWQPGGFYLIARGLSAFLSLAVVGWVYRTGRLLVPEKNRRLGLWAAAFLAVSPPLIESAHAAKPDSALLFFSAACWYFSLRYHQRDRPRDLLAAAAAAGLAMSSQYTALPLALVLAGVCLLKREIKRLFLAGAAVIAAFFLGSPFILLDWRDFLRDIKDLAGYYIAAPERWAVVHNILCFAGPWTSAVFLALGAAWLCLDKRGRGRAGLFLVPIAAQVIALSLTSSKAGPPRYLYAVFPALALVAAFGAEAFLDFFRMPPWSHAIFLACLMLPGAAESYGDDRRLLLPDTRTMATRWMESHVPSGARVLVGRDNEGPSLRPSRPQVERLLDKTRKAGHPRQKYYELMLDSHPGGGYEVFWMLRDSSEMNVGAWHQAWSMQGRDVLDVRGGLRAALDAGIQIVVLTENEMTGDSPSISRLVGDVRRSGVLQAEFPPQGAVAAGPHLWIYKISSGSRGGA